MHPNNNIDITIQLLSTYYNYVIKLYIWSNYYFSYCFLKIYLPLLFVMLLINRLMIHDD